MALGRAFAVAVRGLDGQIVEIEADVTAGLPGVHLVGLPDAALQESRDRVRAAITNCGQSWPMSRLTLALSPATLPKTGSLYDLALACAVLSAGRTHSGAATVGVLPLTSPTCRSPASRPRVRSSRTAVSVDTLSCNSANSTTRDSSPGACTTEADPSRVGAVASGTPV